MDQQQIIQKTVDHLRSAFEGEGSGHDWWHIERVWKTSVYLAKREHADLFVVQLAALLHDIADWKFHGGSLEEGPKQAREWLSKFDVPEETIAHVCSIIKTLSFKGMGAISPMETKEGMIVQDADRLDAIGAIGIARAFAYGGYKGREIYNPNQSPEIHTTFDEYKKSEGSTINHFYEKLLHLKDLMNTSTAKTLAEDRHLFMEKFLEQFYKEWEAN